MKTNLKVAIGIAFLFILFFCLLIPINNARKGSIVKRAAERTKVTEEQMADLAEEKEITLKQEQLQQYKEKYDDLTLTETDVYTLQQAEKNKEIFEGTSDNEIKNENKRLGKAIEKTRGEINRGVYIVQGYGGSEFDNWKIYGNLIEMQLRNEGELFRRMKEKQNNQKKK